MKGYIVCRCGELVECSPPEPARCKCGRVYLYKRRSGHYILAKEL